MDEARLISLGRLTASGLVTDRACLVYSICSIGTSQTSNVFNIFDGFNTGGKHIMTLGGAQYFSDFRLFAMPLYFAKGVYVEFATNGTECFVQYMEVGR